MSGTGAYTVSLLGNIFLRSFRGSRVATRRTNSHWLIGATLQLALLVSLVTPMAAHAQDQSGQTLQPRVGAALLQQAASNPNQSFRVIVVRTGQSTEADTHVSALGGNKIQDVGDLGFAAQVNGNAITSLASDPAVKAVSVDAPMVPVDCRNPVGTCDLATIYPQAIKATQDWQRHEGVSGKGVGVAVVDTGIAPKTDFLDGQGNSRVIAQTTVDLRSAGPSDQYGHGTHVAGIIAGNSWWSTDPSLQGKYLGVAPEANLINVKVSDDQGTTYLSDVINGIDWAIVHRQTYNIRVLNLSLESTVPESYTTSILDAEVERAWFSGILVVVAAGNNGADSELYPPANDPFVVTVGASDPRGTIGTGDDGIAPWSSYGITQDGFAKPDVVAPGRYITSVLASPSSTLAQEFPDRIVDGQYLWLSGTSMSAGVVSGLGALLFQAHPEWTNDQAKWVLEQTSTRLHGTPDMEPIGLAGQGFGEVDALRSVVYSRKPVYQNQGLTISSLLLGPNGATTYSNTIGDPTSSSWSSSSWSSSSWSSSSWSSSSWSSSSWSSSSWSNAESQP